MERPRLIFLLMIVAGSIESPASELERRLEEQERQIRLLESENDRLRWVIQRQENPASLIGEPLYATSGQGQKEPESARTPQTHTVVEGETLSGIARRVGTDHEQLATLNHLTDPGLIRPGQRLRLPAPFVTDTPSVEPQQPTTASQRPAVAIQESHVVRAGENLYRIALRHGITLEQVLAANPDVVPHSLQVGQVILIERSTPEPAPSLRQGEPPHMATLADSSM